MYDHDANPLQALEEPVVHAAVGDARGLSALDLGCGAGRHALWLAAAAASVTAVDFSEGMLAEARKKTGAEAVRLVIHDLHAPLPFTDPPSGERSALGSVPHSVSDFVMAAVRAGYRLADVVEFAPDDEFAKRFTRAEKYVGWPMLVVLRLEA